MIQVDTEDETLLSAHGWHVDGNGYVRATIDGVIVYLHRLIMCAKEGEVVDHRNGDTADNRRENLRVCTQAQNSRNARISRRNTSGLKGVSWHAPRALWRARVFCEGRTVHSSYHVHMCDAEDAVRKARTLAHKDFKNDG